MELSSTSPPGVGLEVFEFFAVEIGLLFLFAFGKACGRISQEITVQFLTVQEEPFKIPVPRKQTPSPCTGQGGRIPPRGQETGSSEPLLLFVFTGHLLFQIWS